MTEYTVHTTYRRFDARTGSVRAFCQTDKIKAEDKETAKTIAWQQILGEYPYCHFESQNARASRRK